MTPELSELGPSSHAGVDGLTASSLTLLPRRHSTTVSTCRLFFEFGDCMRPVENMHIYVAWLIFLQFSLRLQLGGLSFSV